MSYKNTNKELLDWISLFLLKNDTALYSARVRDKFLKNSYLDNYNEVVGLTSFLEEDVKVSERLYCILNDIYNIVICGSSSCNNEVKFVKFRMGYKSYCCNKCQRLDQENINIKQLDSNKKTCLEKYGVENVFQLEEVKEKIKETCVEKYGVENSFQSVEVRAKQKETMVERYSADHNMRSDFLKERLKERYGGIFPMHSEESKQKIEETFDKKYGGRFAGSPIIKDKIKKTVKERYNVDWITKSKFIKNKIKHTVKERYGVDHAMQSPIIKDKIKKTCQERYRVNSPSQIKLNDKNMLDKLHDKEWLKHQHHDLKKSCIDITKEFNLNRGTIIYFMSKSGIDVKRYPSSSLEKEIANYINIENIQTNTRKIIPPLELDIYLPDYNLAIEYNGLYWHSLHNKDYHLNKTEKCAEKGIQLLHIFESEWLDSTKRDIWKSIISNKLGRNNTIYARKTEIKEITDNKQIKEFLDNNHLQCFVGSSIKLGLFYSDELVSLMMFGKSRFSKKYEWEMIRFCNKKFLSVVGGASKLYKYFVRNYKPKSVVSYADRRYSDGGLYRQLGFELSHNSDPNYWYFKNNEFVLYNRIHFQKHKLSLLLEKFDSNITEVENMTENGYLRIFDCGNMVYYNLINS